MNEINRRSFLGLVGAAALFPKASFAKLAKIAAPPVTPVPRGLRGTLVSAQVGRINLLDLATGKISFFSAELMNGHSVELCAARPNIAAAMDFEKGGAVFVDLKRRKVLKSYSPPSGYFIAGHGCFSPDGKKFYLSEFPDDRQSVGQVRVLDAETWEPIGVFPTGYAQPQMVLPVKGGAELAVGHYGVLPKVGDGPTRNGPVVFLDSADGKTLRLFQPENGRYSTCHMAKTSKDQLIISSRSFLRPAGKKVFLKEDHFPAPLIVLDPDGRHQDLFPQEVADQMRLNFTVIVDEAAGRILVNHMITGRLSAWSLSGGKLQLMKEFSGERTLGLGQLPGLKGYFLSTDASKFYLLNEGDLSILHIFDFAKQDGFSPPPHFTLTGEVFPG